MTSNLGKVRIHVVEADDVPKMDTFGGKSDVMIEIEVAGKFRRTKVKNNAVHPIWDEKFEFPYEKLDERLVFAMYDSDGLSKNDLIGKVQFYISDLKHGSNDLWLPYPEKKGAVAKLHVVLSLDPTIHINVLNATNLKSTDLNGKADPYVIIVYGKQKVKTKTIKNSLNPNWREFFVLESDSVDDPVMFQVYDNDFGRDDLLGKAILTLSALNQKISKVDLNLEKGGQLHLEITKIGFPENQYSGDFQQQNQFSQQQGSFNNNYSGGMMMNQEFNNQQNQGYNNQQQGYNNQQNQGFNNFSGGIIDQGFNSFSGGIQQQNQGFNNYSGGIQQNQGFNNYTGGIQQQQNQQQQQYGGYIQQQQSTNSQAISNWIGNGAISVVWEAQRAHAGIYFTLNGNLIHKYVHSGQWGDEILAKNIYGDVSSVYEPQRSHAAFFYKGQDGYLKYTYFNGSSWATSDCYQKGGKVGGRICTVFETHRTHSACFFVGEDAKIHYFYVENGAWQYYCFGDAPCTGDLAAVYEPQRNSSAFVYDSNGQLQYNYFNGQQWTKDATTFVEPCTGAISIVFEKQRNHTGIFYASKGDLIYYYVDQMWRCSKNLFKPEIIGDVTTIFNDTTQHTEVLYVTKFGIQHYFVQNSAWNSIGHQVDCVSTLDAIYQPSRKAAEFFYVSSDGKTHYGYLNGNNFSFSTW